MSHFLDSFEVFDLALGKPPLHCLPSNATLKDALELSKELGMREISVWDEELRNCLGIVNNLDILCFLAAEENLPKLDDAEAFSSQVTVAHLIHKASIQHVNLDDRLSKALELVIQGVQYLIVPLPTSMRNSSKLPPKDTRWPCKDLCWISQEVVMRFLMSCIAAFCPLPLFSIDELGIINRDIISVHHNAPAITALHLIQKASLNMSAVAIVRDDDDDDTVKLLGDISSTTLSNYDEILTVAALATLSAADFLTFIHGGSKRSSRSLGKMITARLAQKLSVSVVPKVTTSLEIAEESSDSEHDSKKKSSSKPPGQRGCLTCRPWSSLAAVMAQALSHQCSYIWVTDAENTMVGIVTYVDIIRVLVKKVDQTGPSNPSQKLFSSTPKLVNVVSIH